MKQDQTKTPILDALDEYKKRRVVSFDVPGHKQGRGAPDLKNFLGEKCISIDVNSMKPLDNLCHPTSVIKEAEALAADAFQSTDAFFMVGGTTSSVQAMIMSACGQGDKIIMPRNVHRSAINALILCGAVPVYVNPGINTKLGIPLGMAVTDIESAIKENPDAKAVFVNNPTYYGVCSDLKAIITLAHSHNMLVICDEAHGTHFYFGEGLPPAAMALGADMSAVSVHKTGGSLTQSSLLLVNNKRVNPDHVRTIINLTQTTSGSYLLLASLDITRRSLALRGKETFSKVTSLASYARNEINSIGGYYAFSKELINSTSFYDFDITKLSVHTLDIGLAGIEVYDILRDDYGIQIEFGDLGNFLAIISVGDRNLEIERLVAALTEIKRLYMKSKAGMFDHEYITPVVTMSPKDAFYAQKQTKKLVDCKNRISGEFVMCYPPGIPILAPGEVVTKETIDYIRYSKEKGCLITGAEDMNTDSLNILI
ncbi:MAG: arginine decarboxylase [Clostridiales bacterium 43-6]|nr:MAG: arginine decarboxylase [Clostridiales bacterium 43-6]